jgi:tripartite-type tricarboxylate transporter receptor subunit TctC
MQTWKLLLTSLAFAITPGNLSPVAAQSYPSRPVKIIVPSTAGGPGDTVARIVADGMRMSLGQPVIIENVAGASGSLGVGRVARATPDGYTIGLMSDAWSVYNGAIFNLPYDLTKDFDPVSPICENPMILVGRADLVPRNLKELVDWLKARPGKALMGTAGAGSVGHIFGVGFEQTTGTEVAFVPFRGFAEVGNELIAKRIDLAIGPVPGFLPQVRAETIRAYAVLGKTRLADAPDIPTADEAGITGLYLAGWLGFFAPHDTPKDSVAKLNVAIANALNDPAVRQRLANTGAIVFPPDQLSPQTLGAYQKAGIAKWWPIIKAAGIKAE